MMFYITQPAMEGIFFFFDSYMVGYFVWLLRNAGKGRSIEFLTFG